MRMSTRVGMQGRLSTRNYRWLAGGAVGLIALAAAACGSSVAAAPPSAKTHSTANLKASTLVSVMTAKNSTLGTILVDQAGSTLYTYTSDTKDTTTCTGACAAAWPPLTLSPGTTKATAGPGVTASQLGTFTRPGGAVQVTFNGMPLYRFASDTLPGQARGQGAEGKWFVVSTSGASAARPASPAPASNSTPTSTAATPTTPQQIAPSSQMGSTATPATTPQPPAANSVTPAPAPAPPATAPPTTTPPATAPPATPPTTTPTTQPVGGGYGY
jgi:predicted lipoprotein with Yx(FWY)xxD motif